MFCTYCRDSIYIRCESLAALEAVHSDIDLIAHRHGIALSCSYNWRGDLTSLSCAPFMSSGMAFFHLIAPYVNDGGWIEFSCECPRHGLEIHRHTYNAGKIVLAIRQLGEFR